MNKRLALGIVAAIVFGLATPSYAQSAFDGKIRKDLKERRYKDAYTDFKDKAAKYLNITFDGAVTALAQRGTPSGHITPIQMQYFAEANWDMFKSESIGEGSMQISYTKVRYQGRTADELDGNLGVLSDINDYSANANYLNQLSYTHKLPGSMKWLSLTVGQFPMWLFDGNKYASDQQTDFNNLVLSQNGTSSYPSASMGGFATAKPNDEWSFTAGFQDANNTSGEKMEFSTFNDGDYTTFLQTAYTPTINGWGPGSYALMVYNQPKVDAQPRETNGWSLSVSQDFGDKWGAFTRVNGNTGSKWIKQSYSFGGVYKDPLERGNQLDKIGFATAFNKANKNVVGGDCRGMETMLETYWDVGISDYLIVTPDIQYYIKPALNPEHDSAAVFSLRATLLF